jgi:hypothetical protein
LALRRAKRIASCRKDWYESLLQRPERLVF